ncbi:NeuD/PglB/VioB family sugar acetyltransferase [Anaerovibrio lipolyticus]|uniref:NeuD/PglB/VioB family sugar acetyltransferase n=1 Tax=Anaerovibrio lipolyticus TaxID=82374 RepID=UPI000483ABF6|nr:NeuD/PglB/VioB family sugar acetyltransferase [Anaerovibrio lipolyticus]
MKHLVIIGVGGFAREVFRYSMASRGYGEEWILKGFLDGDVVLPDYEYEKLELPLLGNVDDYELQPDDVFICAIADSLVRKRLTDKIRQKGGHFINIISTSAIIHGNVRMGEGNIVCPFVNINDRSVVGDFVIFNVRSGIGHDSQVGSYTSFMGGAGLCGYAKIGKNSFMATYSVALPHSQIGDGCYIGAGSIVFKRVKDGQKVFGNPAMPI